MLLEVENVTAGYGAGPNILDGVSLRIEQGKSYCIIGPNGAGKSTLLRTICGLLRPRSGRIIFKGEVLNNLRPDQILRKGICFVPQDRSLFPEMSVKENLLMAGYTLTNKQDLEQRIQTVFEIFPVLKERQSQLAQTLSGGEQQMLAMARALILKPDVIMLDEPSLGLAPLVAIQVFESIKKLKELGMTILLVEQNARKGLECADWGYVLDLGKNRFEGPAHSLLHDPQIEELYLGKRRGTRPQGKTRTLEQGVDGS
ncbi:MAG: ABC transporter ATP-binding protein [Armatimonadota bacterium]|nr:ABC transporter ATP-binding protein [Armatimonadota bacterium]